MEDERKPETAPKSEEKKKPRYQELSASKHLDTKEQKAVVGGGSNIPTDSSTITRPSTPVVPSTRGRGGGRYGKILRLN